MRSRPVQLSAERADGPDMWLDLIALLILGCFATLGAIKGALPSLFGILALIAGYLAAVALSPLVGPLLAPALGVPELLAIPLAGTGLFFGAFGVVALAGKLLARTWHRGDGARSARDRFLGGAFGALRGLLVVVLVSWLAVWVDALRVSGVAPELPSVENSAAASLSSDLIESGIEALLADAGAGGRVVARIAARPAMAVAELQVLVDDPSISSLRSDPMFWTYVEHGNVDSAMNRIAFVKFARNDSMRRRLGDLGLVDEASVADAHAFRVEFGQVLAEVGPRIQGLRNDPELQALAKNPEIIGIVQRGDTLALLGHPGIRKLVARVSSDASD